MGTKTNSCSSSPNNNTLDSHLQVDNIMELHQLIIKFQHSLHLQDLINMDIHTLLVMVHLMVKLHLKDTMVVLLLACKVTSQAISHFLTLMEAFLLIKEDSTKIWDPKASRMRLLYLLQSLKQNKLYPNTHLL